MDAKSTSLMVTGLGVVVTGAGATVLKGSLGAGVVGFGLAHIVLGVLDMLRPSGK
ncbi:hypothetical protein RDV78_05720 [Bacillota bacterium LX-D]|nr:hypothetical protein [Bacillota bacterium LX-D]